MKDGIVIFVMLDKMSNLMSENAYKSTLRCPFYKTGNWSDSICIVNYGHYPTGPRAPTSSFSISTSTLVTLCLFGDSHLSGCEVIISLWF